MRAITFDQAGEPATVLRAGEAPEPEPRPGEALVRVSRRPIHPADLAFVRGIYRVRPVFPQVAGLEGAGVVVDGGDTGLKSGQRVAFRSPGAWAELVAVPMERLLLVPDDVDDDRACQISLNPLTAWGLLDVASAVAGQTLMLTAGASTVSNLVAAIARTRGVRTVGLIRGPAAAAQGRSACDVLISVENPDLARTVSEACGGGGPAALLDSVGGAVTPQLLALLQPGGVAVAYGVQDRTPAEVTNALLIYANLTWIGFGIDRWLSGLTTVARAAAVDELWGLVRRGDLPLPVAVTWPMADIQQALGSDAAAGRKGKVLLG